MDLSTHQHDSTKRPLHDARGIFVTYVCNQCEAQKRQGYRADIFTDGNYWSDEPIDDD